MALNDLPLRDGPTGPPPVPPPTSTSPLRWAALGVVALVAGAALAFWWMTRAQPGDPLPAPTMATEAVRSAGRPVRQPIELPALDASDALLRQLIGVLARHPQIARLLATDGLVRRITLSVDQIGDGRTPSVPLATLRPTSRLAVGDGNILDVRTYERWDASVTALTAINPGEAAQLYVNLKPLFDSAHADLGHPSADFDTALVRAFDVLLATPHPVAPPRLLRRPGYFEHEDAALRALKPVQKQFLLVGPDAQRQVTNWIRRFAAALELRLTL